MDPITFSIIRHRLFRVIDEAVITLKHVSGTAITNEGHDLMVSLYRPDGALLMGGVGFLHHLTSAAEACKAVIRRFGDKIYEDDIFLLNDPYTAALHTSDIYLVSPIHYRGKLVAWSACFVHVYDIGAMNPGGFSPDSRDIFTEGISSPGIKLVERGEIRQDVFDTLLNMVRSPEMVTLDIKSMIACNNVAKDRMRALFDKYGEATIEEVALTLTAQSETLVRARLAELPRGRWQSRQYIEVCGETSKVTLTMTNTGNELIFDFTGSSPQSKYAINCTKWACLGGLFAPLFPLICYDITWNEGVTRTVKMIAPEGSIVNCTRPAPVSVATVGAIQSVNNAACATIGKMLAASDKYREDTEVFAGAGGGRSFADGVDVGGEIPNPISRMANVETIEQTFPVRYLFRRRRIDSGGPGAYRGGVGMEMALAPHRAQDGGLHYVISGKGQRHPMSDGLAGGYPGAPNEYTWVHNNESNTGSPAQTFAGTLEEMPGRMEKVSWGVYPLDGRDVLYVAWNGGGGYGDPRTREPASVLADVAEGLVSRWAAEAVYGVVIKADGVTIDTTATNQLRRQIAASRQMVAAQ
jgi:N-methylhydantoinase B